MTFPATFPVPDCLSVPDLADAVAADFAARGVAIPVVFGGFDLSKHRGPSKVTISLDNYDFGDIGPPNAPGPQILAAAHAAQVAAWYAARGIVLPDPFAGFQARSLFSCVQACVVTCFAEPDPNPKASGRTVTANRAAAKLRNLTAAALYRAAHGSFSLSLGGGQWVDANHVEGFIYGSLTAFRAQIWVPVLDDAEPLIQGDPDTTITSVIWSGPSGDAVVATTPDP